ncbi:MAG: DUF1573 domain-containing protein [Verrucomicrobia bacterium]|nr:DUF1573 domain-containing protein [Verrucomicrobiota bacterium]
MKTLNAQIKTARYAGLILWLSVVASFAQNLSQNPALVWDATSKTYNAQKGETNVLMAFNLTNTAPSEVAVNAVRTSCGCTIAKLPTLPWRLAAGASGQLEIRVDLRGKRGLLSKIVSVDSTAGLSLLTVNVNIPEPDPRELNQMMALADRQAVFRGDCATCHVHPTLGKTGEALYKTACGICHEAEHRASMVPDLKALSMTKPTDKNYWDNWVRFGRPGTLMPAFTKAAGGPLDDAQIQSLVTFLSDHFRPAKSSDFGDPFGGTSGSSF